MDLFLEEHLAMICTTDVLSQCTRILLSLNWSPQIARAMVMAYNSLQLMLMSLSRSRHLGTHPDTSVLESSSWSLHHWHQWKADIPHWWASGIHTTGWPIPCSQIAQPPVNVPIKLLIQLDSVVKMPSFHGCFDHMVKEGSARPQTWHIKSSLLLAIELTIWWWIDGPQCPWKGR